MNPNVDTSIGCRHSLGGAASGRRVVGPRVAARNEISGTGQRPRRLAHRSKTMWGKTKTPSRPNRSSRRSRWAYLTRPACKRTQSAIRRRKRPSRTTPYQWARPDQLRNQPAGVAGPLWNRDPSGRFALD